MRNRQKSASNKNGYKPRNPDSKKKPYISHIENISPKMPWLSPIYVGQYKMRGQNKSDKTKNF